MNLDKVPRPTRRKGRRANAATYQQQYDRALMLWESGSKENAVAQLQMALEGTPNRADGWCELGQFYDALSSEAERDEAEADRLRDKAVMALRRAIELSPDFAKAHFALANVYWRRDLRRALAELELAATYAPQEYESILEGARTTVRECTYRLARMNVIVLDSAHEVPHARILNTDFFFAEVKIGCAVVHTRVSDTLRHSFHVWLMAPEHPDLNRDEPVAELTVSAVGEVAIFEGCPANYHALRTQPGTIGVLAGWLGTSGPPAGASTRAVRVEDDTRDMRQVAAQTVRSAPPRIETKAAPPAVDVGEVLRSAALKVRENGRAPLYVPSPRRSRRIVWVCLGAVLIAGAAIMFYFGNVDEPYISDNVSVPKAFEQVDAPKTFDEQTSLNLESPGLPGVALPPVATEPRK